MNRKNQGANTNTGQICLDILMLVLAYGLANLVYGKQMDIYDIWDSLVMIIIFVVIFILANKEARIYNVTLFFYMDRFFKIISKSWMIAAVTTASILFIMNFRESIRSFYLLYLIFSYFLLCINMVVSRFFAFLFHTYQAPRAAFVGVFADFQKFNYFLNKTSVKLDAIGYILKKGQVSEGRFNVLGNIDELEDIIRNKEVDQIYFMQKSNESISEIQEYIDTCMEMGVTAKVVIDSGNSYVMQKTNSFVSSIGTYPVVTYHTITLNNYEQMLKRAMDIIISIVAIIIASPIMLIAAVAVKLDSPGPIIFAQNRVGQNGRTFKLYKFRSMYIDAEERKKELLAQNEIQGGVMFKMKNDPRVTKVGKFIRKTSIDELPQLFNVLKGSMSLVGTRPPTLDEVAKYKKGQWRRISIKPGITGMWQVSGRSNIDDFDKIVELDLKYIDNWTIWLDIKILFKTIGVIFKNDGAY